MIEQEKESERDTVLFRDRYKEWNGETYRNKDKRYRKREGVRITKVS